MKYNINFSHQVVFMKKYFLLFSSLLISFETGLISASSSLQAMVESEEGKNPQQRRTREEKENPCTDLRLHPAKGETIGVEEKHYWCHHPYLNGKVYSFQYPKITEITLSYPAWFQDLARIEHGLYSY